jgi:hypothetical protein
MDGRTALARLASIVILSGAGCGDGSVSSPSSVPPIIATATPPGPAADPAPQGLTVGGPQGCASAAALPSVVTWAIDNVPEGARFLKAYHHDEEPTCDPTDAERRTENDHLRVVTTGPTSARGEYEVFAYDCGRQQVNISMQVGTEPPQVIVALIIYHEGRTCPGAASPAPAPPAPGGPLPPAAPACEVRTFSGSGSVVIAQRSSGQRQATVSASYSAGNFTGRAGIHWRNNGSTYMKTSQAVNAPCGQPRSGSLSWVSEWVNATHGHVNSGAAYYLVFYTGSDGNPAIVWERRL